MGKRPNKLRLLEEEVRKAKQDWINRNLLDEGEGNYTLLNDIEYKGMVLEEGTRIFIYPYTKDFWIKTHSRQGLGQDLNISDNGEDIICHYHSSGPAYDYKYWYYAPNKPLIANLFDINGCEVCVGNQTYATRIEESNGQKTAITEMHYRFQGGDTEEELVMNCINEYMILSEKDGYFYHKGEEYDDDFYNEKDDY